MKAKTEIMYTQNGDYQIPDIQMAVTERRALNRFGRMRRTWLQENNPILYSDLVLTEQLFPHLWEIQEAAQSRMELLMRQLLETSPAPDKRTNQLGWVQHMNMLRAQAEEIVTAELIYS